jgi:hypothetical protein
MLMFQANKHSFKYIHFNLVNYNLFLYFIEVFFYFILFKIFNIDLSN